MQTLDDLFERSGVHRHLIAPGRGAGTREEPDRHLFANCHSARVGQRAPRPQTGWAMSWVRSARRSSPMGSVASSGTMATRPASECTRSTCSISPAAR